MRHNEYQEFDMEEELEINPEFYETDFEVRQRYNLSNDYVKWVQTMLNRIIGLRLSIDGKMGPATRSALRNFQNKMGLKPDGALDTNTKNALIRAGTTQRTPVATHSSYVNWSKTLLDQRIIYVMDLLVKRYNFPVNAASGIVGNLISESEIIPNRVQGSNKTTPMTAKNFHGNVTTFSPKEIMNRSESKGIGPFLGGIGIAQWTKDNRRRGLFRHSFNGRQLGENIIFDMNAQVDYLVHELQTNYRSVYNFLKTPGITVNDASDEIVYKFESPGTVFKSLKPLVFHPRNHPQVQAEFMRRRHKSNQAFEVYKAYLSSYRG